MKVKDLLGKMTLNSDVGVVELREFGAPVKAAATVLISYLIESYGNRAVNTFEIRETPETRMFVINLKPIN